MKNLSQDYFHPVSHGFSFSNGIVSGVDISGDRDRSVVSLILEHAAQTPEAEAMISKGRSYSYLHLVRWAEKIRTSFDTGAQCADPIAILMKPGATMIAAALGVMRSGRAYLPLDPKFSDERIAVVLASADVKTIIADKELQGRGARFGADLIVAEELFEPLDLVNVAVDDVDVAPESNAYLIYTSGSTGVPKGVPIKHRNLAAMTAARRMVYPGLPRFLMVSPLACDSSIAGIWGTLTAGGTLVLPSADEISDPEALIGVAISARATHLLCVPSLYSAVLDEVERAQRPFFGIMSCVIVAGEALHSDLVDRHFRLSQDGAKLVNEYGPTEATVWASYQVVEKAGPVSIGGPVPGVDLLAINGDGAPVEIGGIGELCIGGAGVSAGYFNNSAATEQAFFTHRLPDGKTVRFYKTGDIVRLLPSKTLDFIGRADQQVKIRGYRVDLLTLEATLRSMKGTRDACAVFDPDTAVLSAFVERELPIGEEIVRAWVREKLGPNYVPVHVWCKSALPKTIAGKIDRIDLAQQAREAVTMRAQQSEPVPVAGQIQSSIDIISRAWAEVLGTDEVPRDRNFMDLGGHSLLVFQLQEVIEKLSGFRPSAIELFRKPTVIEQARMLDGATAALPGAGQGNAAAGQTEQENNIRDRRIAKVQGRRSRADLEKVKGA